MNPAGVRIVISALDKTKGAFGSATRGISAVAGALTGLKAGLVAVAGAGGFAYMVKSSIDATDALAKTASKIGTTTEALSALRYAANLSGVETNTLDMAMQRFTRRLSEAVKGTGEAKGALQELQLNARDLAGLPLDQRMAVLADAFGNVSSETDKLRLAFKLFDSEGVALVNMLNKGSDGLQGMFDDAEALGLIMRSNAAKGVEQASDSLYRMGRVAIGVRDSFVAGIAPAIKLVSDRIVTLVKEAVESRGGFQQFSEFLVNAFLDIVQSLGIAFINIKGDINDLIGQAKKLQDAFTFKWGLPQQNPLERIPKDVEKAQKALDELDWLMQEAEAGGSTMYNGQIMSLEELRAEYDRITDRVAMWQEELFKASNTLDLVAGADTRADIAKLVELINQLRPAATGVFDDLAKDADDKLPEALTVFERIGESFRKTVGLVSGEIPTLEQSVESLTRGAMNNFTQSFTDAITGAKKFGDAMKSMAKSVVDSLIKMLVQYYITEPLFRALQAGFGSFTGGGGAGGGGKAIGGSVQAGTPYMVGERGQELFVPNQSGTIIPNNKLGGGGSSIVVQQTINVTTGVQQTVRAEIQGLMPQIANAAKSAVANSRMRGGGYSKALVGA